jgi:phosphonate transport system substrate-binding protein
MNIVSKFAALAAVSMIALNATSAVAEDKISEFRIGILGGENANDRLRAYACLERQDRGPARRSGQAVRPGRL